MRKIILFFCFIVINLFFSQTEQNTLIGKYQKFPLAPSTSTFLRYGNVELSEYTGTNAPKISLYNVISGKTKLPLDLVYISGNGIKVTDEASNVGLGWSLPIPTITQIVRGYDDFDVNFPKMRPDFAVSNTPVPYMFQDEGPTNFNYTPQINSFGYFYTFKNLLPLSGTFTLQHIGYFDLTPLDFEPDIFILNILGEKLEFIIDNYPMGNNYTKNFSDLIFFKALNNRGYKIKYENKSFTVTSPDGIRYLFSDKEEVEGVNQKIQQRNYMLNKVSDYNNNEIIINYGQTEKTNNLSAYIGKLKYGLTTSTSGILYLHFGQYDGVYDNFISSGSNTEIAEYYPQVGKFLVDEIDFNKSATVQNYLFPTSISFDGNIISFKYSERIDSPNKKLDTLIIKNYYGGVIKKINFNYNYFDSSLSTNIYRSNLSSDRLSKRLKLENIKISDEEIYNFEYCDIKLPPKNSFAIDYWGYYNGATNNKTFFANPEDFNNTNVPLEIGINDNIKTPNLNFIIAGLLQKINFPTKGYTRYEYELNHADNLFIDNYKYVHGMGLRLKIQKNYDSNNNISNNISFQYENGKTINPLTVFKDQNINNFKFGLGEGTGIITRVNYKLINVNSNISPYSSGNYLGYEKVTKIESDSLHLNKGKIEKTYTNKPDVYFNYYGRVNFILPSVKNSFEENGKELMVEYFDNNIIQKKITNRYHTTFSKISYGVLKTNNFKQYLSTQYNAWGNYYSYGFEPVSVLGYYPIFSKESFLDSTEIIEYLNNNELSSSINYIYNLNGNLIKEQTILPDGKNLYKLTNYADEENNYKLKDANILNVPLKKSTTSDLNKSLHSNLTRYDGNGLNPTSIYQIEKNTNSSYSKEIISFDKYDIKGNLEQYRSSSGNPVTIIWGYNQTQPIAKIEGATYEQVEPYILDIITKSNSDTDQASEDVLISALDTFRANINLKNYQITTYTYDPLIGVTSITSANGVREIYKYDTDNRLEKVVDVNDNILKEYKYNYAKQKYYNNEQSKEFIKNNCESNYIGGKYTYVVPSDKYFSYISTEDANEEAINDLNTNGQNQANIYGSCTKLDCIFKINYPLINGSGGLYLYDSTRFVVSMGYSFNSNLDWTNGVLIGKIQGNCLSPNERTSSSYSNGLWGATIKPNGDVIVKFMPGPSFTWPTNGTNISLQLFYSL